MGCQGTIRVVFLVPQGPCTRGRVKQGRFVILRFPLFCSVWGSQDTQMLGKTARKVSLPHPFFCVPQMLVKTRTWEQCPHMLAGKARGKWQIDPILPTCTVFPSPESPPLCFSLNIRFYPLFFSFPSQTCIQENCGHAPGSPKHPFAMGSHHPSPIRS